MSENIGGVSMDEILTAAAIDEPEGTNPPQDSHDPVAVKTVICPYCQNETPESSKFCAKCGYDLRAQSGAPTPEPPAWGEPAPPVWVDQPPVPPVSQPNTSPGRGLSIAGLVCGIVSLVFMFFLPWFCLLPALVGLILSAVAKSKDKKAGIKNGLATGGLVTSIITLAIGFIVSLILTFVVSSLANYSF